MNEVFLRYLDPGLRYIRTQAPARVRSRASRLRVACVSLTSGNVLAGRGLRRARRSLRPDPRGAGPGRAIAEDMTGAGRSKVQRHCGRWREWPP